MKRDCDSEKPMDDSGMSLEELVMTTVPYVLATISDVAVRGPYGFEAKESDEWVRVHHGRIISCRNQLERLMKMSRQSVGKGDMT